MITTAFFLFYFLTPLLISYLCYKLKNLNKIGSIIITIFTGIIVGNILIIPLGSNAFRNLLVGRTFIPKTDALELFQQGVIRHSDLILNQITSIQDMIISIIVPISIPLLLFTFDLKRLSITLKKEFVSIAIAFLSLISCILVGYFLFKNSIPEAWKISGMMAGIFIGGTPTLATLTTALDISPNLFILIQTFDIIIGALILLFLISPARQLFKSILSHFNEDRELNKTENSIKHVEVPVNLLKDLSLKTILPLISTLSISILIVAICYEISIILPIKYQKATLFLLVTAVGILCGCIPKINKVEKTFKLGIYFILVFCLIASSKVDFRTIFQPDLLLIFLYMISTVFVSIAIFIILSTIFKIETDLTFVTIAALFLSPIFIPLVSERLKKKELVPTIFTLSLLGIATGNILSIFFSYLLKSF